MELLGSIAVLLVFAAALYFIVYHAVKNAIRDGARATTDEVVVRLLTHGWSPPGERAPEAREIMREDAQDHAGD
ncbi:hypothetical protein BH24ACT15_BH24ACT15_08050 [soil metagenome]|jgi:hypothetical protein